MATIELTVDGVRVEFRKDLTLKHSSLTDEQDKCLPENIKRGSFYKFSLSGYNIFPIGKAIPLFEEGVRDPVASISIIESTNFLLGGYIDTRGEYIVRACSRDYKEGLTG